MPPTTGTSKSKKGFRGFIRDTFGCTSSHPLKSPTTSQRPVSRTLFPPNESHVPKHESGSVDVPPPAEKGPVASHSIPSTVGTEHVDSQPTSPSSDVPATPDPSGIPRSIRERPVDSQSLSAIAATSVEFADSQPDLLSTDTPIVVDAYDITSTTVWTGLKTSLQDLSDCSGMLLPLASAADTLLGCIAGMEIFAKSQQSYKELAAELATLGNTLAEYIRTLNSTETSKCISGISFEIKREAQKMEGKLYPGTGREPLLAKEDEDEVVRHFREIQSLFRKLETNFSMHHWGIENENLVNSRLEGIRPVREATYDSTLSSTINRRTCAAGTRTEVLANLIKWARVPESPAVYWMNGMAGTGKTTIACSFSEWLEREELLAASFFFTRTTADCRDVTRLIPTIAYQLARYSIPFQSALHEALDGGSATTPKTAQMQFEHLLRDPLLRSKGSLPEHLVVVIDGLDECDDPNAMEMMLDVLLRQAPLVPLKFFFTSRSEMYSRVFSRPQGGIHLHDIEESQVQADIELYLKSELTSISPSSAEIKQLVQRSGALFIYAATLVRYIQSGKRLAEPYKRLRSVLNIIPEATKLHAQIDALYTAVLKSALSEDELEADKTKDIRMVLWAVLFAQEPIDIETVAMLAGIDDPKRVHSALQPLRSVLYYSEETSLVSTLHASFSDFMLDHERSGAYFCDIVECNRTLVERCFSVMKEQLRFNICDLESSFIPDAKVDNIRRRIQEKIPPGLAYACRYWASHLAFTSEPDNLLAKLQDFLCHRLLFWMEVLNLKREMVSGVEGLLRVKKWLNEARSASELMVLAEDALNFAKDFAGTPVSDSTPHIYISMLSFCPRSSSIFKHYWKSTQGLLELSGSLMEHREAEPLATWDIGSEVYSVAYSPDGTRVAVGCEKDGVRILNAHDGTQLLCLSQSDSHGANSVAFSPDGKSVASGHGIKDCTIRVWNAYNGALITRPHRCDTDIHCVSFSPDGTRLAFGSYGKDVYIWNTHDGALFQSPINHFYHVFSVVFSPDGAVVASSSSISTKGTIHLWNSHDGTPTTSPLQGHTGHVLSVAFTPDGTRLVSGSEDKTIRIWRVSDGSPVGSPFQGHTQGVRSVAVSPDGTRVASGSNDRTVRVWKIDDGTLVAGPFVGHSARICSVAYSPDGTRVISGSSDHTIRVWNVRDGLLPPPNTFKRHMSRLKSISFFGNGAQILSASEDSGFWVWDIPPCEVDSHSAEHDSPSPTLPTTGPNAGIVPKDRSDTINSYAISGLLKGHKDPLTSTVVSTDSTLLVTGFRNGLIRVWNLQKGELIARPFHGHCGEVTSLLLSSDHSHVISCSKEDSTIRIWDTRNLILSVAPANSLTEPLPAEGEDHFLDGWNIREDGWVTDSNSRLLFWVPRDLASNHAWPSPHAEFIITKDGVMHTPRQELLIGHQWSRCFLVD